MNKTLSTVTTAVVFGALSNVAMAGDALDAGDSSNYGQPHAATAAIAQTARASVADIGEAAAYPNRPQGVPAARAQQDDRLPVVAGRQAFDSTVYRAN